MSKHIRFIPEYCISCGACVVACIDQRDVKVEKKDQSYRTVLQMEHMQEGKQFLNLSAACMHCEDAPCIKACPCGCISKDPRTGCTVYDNTACIGCHSCAKACPYGAPTFSCDGKMEKCNGCSERVARGMLPACVKVCPMDALVLEDYAQERNERLLKSVAESAVQSYIKTEQEMNV